MGKQTTLIMTDEQLMEIKSVIRRTMEEKLEMQEEVWITEKELCKTFATLKPSWLEKYWSALYALGAARQPSVKDENGDIHRTGRMYARNKIQRLFATGEIERLECRAVVVIG